MNSRSLFIARDWPTLALCFCSVDIRLGLLCSMCTCDYAHDREGEGRKREWQRLNGFNPEEEERIRGRDEAGLWSISARRSADCLLESHEGIQHRLPSFFFFLHLTWLEARTPPPVMVSLLAAFFFSHRLCQVVRWGGRAEGGELTSRWQCVCMATSNCHCVRAFGVLHGGV